MLTAHCSPGAGRKRERIGTAEGVGKRDYVPIKTCTEDQKEEAYETIDTC